AHDGLLLPGLVDLHCHGGGGASFPDASDAAEMLTAVREHRRHGTTSLVASLVTADAATLRERVRDLSQLAADGEIAAIHLEGPFLSVERRGAQNPEHIVDGDAELVRELAAIAGGALATMTVAPEVEGADGVIEALADVGAVPSLGHTDGSSSQMTHAISTARTALRRQRGRSPLPTATHLFNGMRPIHHRDPGPALAALDAADVSVEEGIATLTGAGAIAGGTAHLLDVLRFAVLEAGVDLVQAVRAASSVPAAVLGLQDRIGSRAAGRRADVVLADAQLN